MAANPRMIDTNTHIRKRTGFRFIIFKGAFRETIRLFKVSICIKILSRKLNKYSIIIYRGPKRPSCDKKTKKIYGFSSLFSPEAYLSCLPSKVFVGGAKSKGYPLYAV
jgi:hypothetical protein